MLEWISATLLVVAAVLLTGKAAGWALHKGQRTHGPAEQLHRWRVANDGHIRVIQILGEVHLLFERGTVSTPLSSLSRGEFEAQMKTVKAGAEVPTAAPNLTVEPTPKEAAARG